MLARLKEKLHYSTADETGTIVVIDGAEHGVTDDTTMDLARYVCGGEARQAVVTSLALKLELFLIGKSGFLGLPTKRHKNGLICYNTTLAAFLTSGMYEPNDEHRSWMKKIEEIL